MRIALVCPYSLDVPGGVGTHVLGLARWLNGEGHDPVVIAPGTRPPPGDVEVALLGPAIGFGFNGSVARLAVRPSQARAARSISGSADVVHVHEPLTPGISFACARAAKALVVTHHASFRPGPLTPLLRARSLLLPPRVALAVSAAARATALAVTGRAPRVVPNAISARPAPAPRTGRPTVVFVGRLDEPRKGYDRFTRLASTGLDAHFVAVGPGGRGADGVEELGQVSEADLAAVLGRASVLVAPSRFGESFGMILIEALASGCAVVASDLPGYRAALAHSTVTSWVHVEDQAGLGAALAARLDEPADPSVAWAEASPFFWPAVGPAVLRAYRDALKPPPRSSTMAR